jgi:hypothetical protein
MANIWKPLASKPPVHIVRCAILLQIVGVLVFSIALFVKIPLLLVLAMPIGSVLILLGALAWVWAIFWTE